MGNNGQEVIIIKDDAKQRTRAAELVKQADELVVVSDLGQAQADEIGKTLKAYLEEVEAYFAPEIDQAHKLHKGLCAKRNAVVDPVKEAIKRLGAKLGIYQDNQRRIVAEKEEKARLAAEEKERKERKAIQDKIDAENKKIREAEEAERKRKADEDAAIKATKDKAEKERLAKEAEERREAQAKIDAENAARIAEKTEDLSAKKDNVYVAPKPVAPVVKPAGNVLLFDVDVIVRDASKVPDQYKVVDEAKLKKHFKESKYTMQVPGIVFTKKPVTSFRR